MSRRLVALAVVAIWALTGCVARPEPVAEVETPRPALTVAQAQRWRQTLTSTLEVADRTHSPTRAAEVLAGPDLQGRTADYDKLVRWGRPVPRFASGTKVLTVTGPATSGYPQQALVVSTLTPTQDAPENRMVEVLVRRDAGDRWRRVVGVAARDEDLPAPAVDEHGLGVPPPTAVNGFGLPGAKALAAAVADPSAHGDTFVSTSTLRLFRANFDELRRTSEHTRCTQTVQALTDHHVFATADGGVLVLTTVKVHQEQQMTDGWYFYYPKKEPAHRQYPGHYESGTDTFVATFIVRVPPKGKIDTPGMTSWWVGDAVGPPVDD